jgi:hypothetical protein
MPPHAEPPQREKKIEALSRPLHDALCLRHFPVHPLQLSPLIPSCSNICRILALPNACVSTGTGSRAAVRPQGEMTSDNRTYVSRNLKGLLSFEQDLITGVLQYYNSLLKIPSE